MAVIDAVTNQVTIIPRDEIGHDVLRVAVDGEVAYVASRNQVTSIVDGQLSATVPVGEIMYLGPIDGVIGAQLAGRAVRGAHGARSDGRRATADLCLIFLRPSRDRR